jgi:hypothetical protein
MVVGRDIRKALALQKRDVSMVQGGKLNQIFWAIFEANKNVYVGQHYTLLYKCKNKTVTHAKQINIFERKQKV